MAEEKEAKQAEVKDRALLAAACKDYGIADQFVLSSRVTKDQVVVIVTHGGSRVTWKKGDKVEPLSQIQVTGVNPEAKKKKPVAGKEKKAGKE